MTHTALIYARRSSETGDDYSLDTQADACLKYAATHDLTVSGDVVRENFTGTKHLKDREQGAAVWAKILAGEIDSLIVYAVDRLSRGKARQVLTLIDEILDAGVQLHSVDVGPITDTDDIGLIIRSWQAGEERKKIVDRLMRGKMGKAMSGKWPGDAPLPYGYARTGERKTAEIHIVADLAQNVRLIYDLYTGDQAHGMRGIATALHQRGVASPEGFPTWSLNTIRRVLMNPLYAGRFIYRGVECHASEATKYIDLSSCSAQQTNPNTRYLTFTINPCYYSRMARDTQDRKTDHAAPAGYHDGCVLKFHD